MTPVECCHCYKKCDDETWFTQKNEVNEVYEILEFFKNYIAIITFNHIVRKNITCILKDNFTVTINVFGNRIQSLLNCVS